jgi:hypothetical protein
MQDCRPFDTALHTTNMPKDEKAAASAFNRRLAAWAAVLRRDAGEIILIWSREAFRKVSVKHSSEKHPLTSLVWYLCSYGVMFSFQVPCIFGPILIQEQTNTSEMSLAA